jgi:hypothetical protein
MKQYQDLVRDVVENGIDSGDRTGTGTKSVFGRQTRFDLSQGFPMVTTKKTFWKGVLVELLFFLRGNTSADFLDKHEIKIWKEWTDKNNNLGPVYPHQFRNFNGKYQNVIKKQPKYPFGPVKHDKEKVVTPSGKSFYILNEKDNEVTIQFEKTGYIKTICKNRVYNRNHCDPFELTCCNTGYLEDPTLIKDNRKLHRKWMNMIKRCYNPKWEHYQYYGGRGVIVSDRWLSFKNFLEDVVKLDGYSNNLDNLELDKDLLGNGFLYSKGTCCWLTPEENKRINATRYLYAVEKDGVVFTFLNSSEFMRQNGIKNQGNFNSMLRGERKICEGFVLVSKKDTFKGVDQLQKTIDTIKKDPNSRRIIINL